MNTNTNKHKPIVHNTIPKDLKIRTTHTIGSKRKELQRHFSEKWVIGQISARLNLDKTNQIR